MEFFFGASLRALRNEPAMKPKWMTRIITKVGFEIPKDEHHSLRNRIVCHSNTGSSILQVLLIRMAGNIEEFYFFLGKTGSRWIIRRHPLNLPSLKSVEKRNLLYIKRVIDYFFENNLLQHGFLRIRWV